MIEFTTKDIIKKIGIDPKDVIIMRHSLSNEKCKKHIENGWIKEYTAIQKKTFANKNPKYLMIFISDISTTAYFSKFYKVNGIYPNTKENIPEWFATPEDFNNKEIYMDLEEIETLKKYENRITIEWGKNPIQWCQNGTTEKEILSIKKELIQK